MRWTPCAGSIGRGESAVYAATTSLGFPEGTLWRGQLPPNTVAEVGADRLSLFPFAPPLVPVAETPSPSAVAHLLLPALIREPHGVGGLCNLTRPLWPEGQLPQPAMLVYRALAAWVGEGRVELQTTRVPGMLGEGTVPQTRAAWRA